MTKKRRKGHNYRLPFDYERGGRMRSPLIVLTNNRLNYKIRIFGKIKYNMTKLYYLDSLVNWAKYCDLNEETSVRYNDIYDDFEKQFNPIKGETQSGEMEKWLNKFKNGGFTDKNIQFAIYNDVINRIIYLKRIQ